MDKVIGQLSPEQLAKFNYNIERVSHTKALHDLANANCAIQGRDADIVRLKAEIYRYTECVRKREQNELATKQYNDYLDTLEAELGIKLQSKDNSICTLTGEIKQISQTKPTE